MTHLLCGGGAFWVIKCGHKFRENDNETFKKLKEILNYSKELMKYIGMAIPSFLKSYSWI